MDPTATLWLASLVGAAGFTATGVYLGRMLDGARREAPRALAPAQAPEPESAPAAVAAPAAPAAVEKDSAEAERITALEAKLEVAEANAELADVERAELERQLEAVRVELRADVIARSKAEARAAQLASRLTDVARNRPQPAITAVAPPSRPDPRASVPPPSDRRASLAPGLFAELGDLQKEVTRLRAENQTLTAASSTNRRRKPRPSEELVIPDTDALRRLVERVGRVNGVRGVVVADTMGSVLVGAGEFLEPIGAFGAYVSDAASRAELLLPFESADEVVVRDRTAGVVSTLRLGDPRIELSLVMFAVDETPTREMQLLIAKSGLAR